MTRTRSNSAFSLFELLCILALMGVASLLSARLFAASMTVVRNAPKSQDHFAAVERMSATLRRDVWGAGKIEVSEAHTLTLAQANGASVRWQTTEDTVVRSVADVEQRWTLNVPLTIEQHGSVVVLKSESRDELRFVGQMASAGEKR